MGLFSGLEGNLEKYIEGFFKDKFKGRVQPAEIAKYLAREMRSNRKISVNNVYVPNEYIVYLHPEDYDSVGAFNKLLSLELQDYLEQKAQEKGFTLVGTPLVKVEKKEEIEAGRLKIEAIFGEEIPVNREELQQQGEEIEEADQRTQMYQPFIDTSPIPKISKIASQLIVENGIDEGKIFTIGNYRMVIGRRETCDIVINDSSVSRCHAQLDNNNKTYIITDLQSTNGTFVNGVRVSRKILQHGDALTFGVTECVFKVD